MSRVRLMTWVFLLLSTMFFCLSDFRVASETPLLTMLPYFWTADFDAFAATREWQDFDRRERTRFVRDRLGLWKIQERYYTVRRYLSSDELLRMAREAEARRDHEFLAFAALELPR